MLITYVCDSFDTVIAEMRQAQYGAQSQKYLPSGLSQKKAAGHWHRKADPVQMSENTSRTPSELFTFQEYMIAKTEVLGEHGSGVQRGK